MLVRNCVWRNIFAYFRDIGAPVNWRSVTDIAIFAGGSRCDARAGQILHGVANESPPFDGLSEFKALLLRRQVVEVVPATHYTLRRNTESVMKI